MYQNNNLEKSLTAFSKMNTLSIFLIMGLGGQELIFIALIVLLLFGAKKIPELMKGLGKGIREFKEASKEVKENIEKGLDESR
jgi:sec-independent protein translocase protein TatA